MQNYIRLYCQNDFEKARVLRKPVEVRKGGVRVVVGVIQEQTEWSIIINKRPYLKTLYEFRTKICHLIAFKGGSNSIRA